MIRIKICCIESAAEADLAAAQEPAALGFVSAMPSGPGVISEDLIAEIVPRVPPGIDTFLLTSRTDPAAIVAQQKRCGVGTLQLCDRVSAGVHAELRSVLPAVSLVQVVHVAGAESVDEALDAAVRVDALLLDSGSPDARERTLGGTGRTHDWSYSARIVREAGVPVYLAGGLNAENVVEAIRAVRPAGVDVCSGVRTDGALDADKLKHFVIAARSA